MGSTDIGYAEVQSLFLNSMFFLKLKNWDKESPRKFIRLLSMIQKMCMDEVVIHPLSFLGAYIILSCDVV